LAGSSGRAKPSFEQAQPRVSGIRSVLEAEPSVSDSDWRYAWCDAGAVAFFAGWRQPAFDRERPGSDVDDRHLDFVFGSRLMLSF